MKRPILRMLMAFAAGLSAMTGPGAAGQGVGPAKSVRLVFVGLDKVDVRLWIDGRRVVARHMMVGDWSTALSLSLDGKVRRHSKIVLAVGDKRQQATVGAITKLKTIYLGPLASIKMSDDPPALD